MVLGGVIPNGVRNVIPNGVRNPPNCLFVLAERGIMAMRIETSSAG